MSEKSTSLRASKLKILKQRSEKKYVNTKRSLNFHQAERKALLVQDSDRVLLHTAIVMMIVEMMITDNDDDGDDDDCGGMVLLMMIIDNDDDNDDDNDGGDDDDDW